MGEAVRALVEVPVGQATVAADQRDAIGDRVDDALEEVGEVELHRAK